MGQVTHFGKSPCNAHDSCVCYQKLEDNIEFIKTKGISAFVKSQQSKEELIAAMLDEFNEGRSSWMTSLLIGVPHCGQTMAVMVLSAAEPCYPL